MNLLFNSFSEISQYPSVYVLYQHRDYTVQLPQNNIFHTQGRWHSSPTKEISSKEEKLISTDLHRILSVRGAPFFVASLPFLQTVAMFRNASQFPGNTEMRELYRRHGRYRVVMGTAR